MLVANINLFRAMRRVLGASTVLVIPLLPATLAAQEAPATLAAQEVPVAQTVQKAIVPDDATVADVPSPPLPMPTGEPRLEDFAPLPGNVVWPTVESTTDGEPAEAAGEVRYGVEIKGLSALGLDDEFRSLSSLWTRKNDPANLAQINRRITEDRDLIDQLLRSIGYYGGNTQAVVLPPLRTGAPLLVSLTVDPGPLYTFEAVTVISAEGPAPTDTVKPLLGVKAGDAIDAARVNTAQDGLAVRLSDAGYPFAVIGKPDIVIDHASRTGTLTQSVTLARAACMASFA